MDDIERIYRHLVRTIRANFAPYLTQPFEVGELYQTVLPYRLHRRELGFETNQDYEMAMLELLSGARGYLIVDDKMRDVLSAEQSARNPDPSIVRDFASSHVALAPEPLRRLEIEGRASGAQASVTSPTVPAQSHASGGLVRLAAASPAARPSVPTPSAGLPTEGLNARRTARPITIAPTGENCPFCRGHLPAGRQISFCPHCGQDLTVVHCPACGSELERGWKFCVTCGRSAGDL
jgi:Double zinc ribbon